jgi:hypothetical protein
MSNSLESAEPSQSNGAGMCADHPDLRAAFLCGLCGRAICAICAFTRTDGSRVCTTCASAAAPAESEAPRLVGRGYLPPEHVRFLKCVQHPSIGAVHVCNGCGAPMCALCEFSLPVDLHLCPRCVVAPPKRTSKSRRTLLVAAYAVAAYGTIGLALLTSGALASLLDFDSTHRQRLLGWIFSLGLFFPAIVGAALGIGGIDRRLHNPAAFWIAAVWNSLLLGIHLIFIILGSMRG